MFSQLLTFLREWGKYGVENIMEIAGLVAGILALIVSIIAFVKANKASAKVEELEIHLEHELASNFSDSDESSSSSKKSKRGSSSSSRKKKKRR